MLFKGGKKWWQLLLWKGLLTKSANKTKLSWGWCAKECGISVTMWSLVFLLFFSYLNVLSDIFFTHLLSYQYAYFIHTFQLSCVQQLFLSLSQPRSLSSTYSPILIPFVMLSLRTNLVFCACYNPCSLSILISTWQRNILLHNRLPTFIRLYISNQNKLVTSASWP